MARSDTNQPLADRACARSAKAVQLQAEEKPGPFGRRPGRSDPVHRWLITDSHR